jgi:hypothetical protein
MNEERQGLRNFVGLCGGNFVSLLMGTRWCVNGGEEIMSECEKKELKADT